jgi:ABC-type glycerol-3-phosphate transport system permease component
VRKTAYTLSIVLGSLLIIGGVATWIVVSTTLADQKIVVSDDASCLAGDEVDGPFSAYCEAMVIDKHALEATGGLRYAELGREDPKRETAMTASFLQASLFTSVVAFGVAAMAIAVGVLLGFKGSSQHRLVESTVAARSGLRLGSSNPGSYGVGC